MLLEEVEGNCLGGGDGGGGSSGGGERKGCGGGGCRENYRGEEEVKIGRLKSECAPFSHPPLESEVVL